MDNGHKGEWWNGGWQRWGNSDWGGDKNGKVSHIRKDDRGSVTLNEPGKGYWVDGQPSRYTVTIYTAAPGTQLKSSPDKPSAAGHMWFSISELKNDGSEDKNAYGFGPVQHGILGAGHVIQTDTDEYIDPYYSRTIEITMVQYKKLKEFGDKALDGDEIYFKLYYNGANNSCIDFANSALRFAGLNPTYVRPAVTPSRADPNPYEDKKYEGALKVLDNIPSIKQIRAPSPQSELNTEHHNKMPARTPAQRLLSRNDSVAARDGNTA